MSREIAFLCSVECFIALCHGKDRVDSRQRNKREKEVGFGLRLERVKWKEDTQHNTTQGKRA